MGDGTYAQSAWEQGRPYRTPARVKQTRISAQGVKAVLVRRESEGAIGTEDREDNTTSRKGRAPASIKPCGGVKDR